MDVTPVHPNAIDDLLVLAEEIASGDISEFTHQRIGSVIGAILVACQELRGMDVVGIDNRAALQRALNFLDGDSPRDED